MRNVAAEQMPTVVRADGSRSTSPAKGIFVTDAGQANANKWVARTIITDSSTETSGVLPLLKRKTKLGFVRATKVPRVGHSHSFAIYLTGRLIRLKQRSSTASQRKRSSGDGCNATRRKRSASPTDYLQVKIPHITLNAESIWPEKHAKIEQMLR
jgi:hypothetical protein